MCSELSCKRITSPPLSRFRIRFTTFSAAWFLVSNDRILQPATCIPVDFNPLATLGLVTPKGGRKKRTGPEPAASRKRLHSSTSLLILEGLNKGKKFEWLKEWFPMRCPSLIIISTNFGFAFTLLPMRKKVEEQLNLRRISRIFSERFSHGPSSKVMATFLPEVSPRHKACKRIGSLFERPRKKEELHTGRALKLTSQDEESPWMAEKESGK
jgi:hypothetical protein